MVAPEVLAILPFVLVGAMLYSSVGHGGATVYLAILTLAGFAVGPLSTTVLVLNIVAAGIAFVSFQRAGHLRWGLLLPFVLFSVPAAYFGGLVAISSRAQSLILALALLLAAMRLLAFPKPPRIENVPASGAPFLVAAAALGGLLGFLAGVTGIGGGIFLSPILLVMGWADVRQAGSVASAFIVLNSVAGLAAKLQKTSLDYAFLVPLGAVVIVGALAGSFLGARKIPLRGLQILLGVVLLVAAAKAAL